MDIFPAETGLPIDMTDYCCISMRRVAPSSVASSPNHCNLSLAVLHSSAEDCLQQDEFLSDCAVWCRIHVVSGLCDTTDSFTNSAHLIHHLDGSLMASGETAHEKGL